jgi:hypothetical protein
LWDGGGFYSIDAGSSDGTTGIGWAEASTLLGISGSQTVTWEGVTVDATTLIFKYTYAGDMNLDGVVDATDLALFASDGGSNGASATWLQGDFNYDGVRDAADYAIMMNAYANQGAPL